MVKALDNVDFKKPHVESTWPLKLNLAFIGLKLFIVINGIKTSGLPVQLIQQCIIIN